MEKSMSVLLSLKDHLQLSYPLLTTWTTSNDGNDVQAPIIQTTSSMSTSLVVTLKMKHGGSKRKRKTLIDIDSEYNNIEQLSLKLDLN